VACDDDDLDMDELSVNDELFRLRRALHEAENDVLTLCLRLYSEDENTFALETREVMNRWKPRVKALMGGEGGADDYILIPIKDLNNDC
jgi:hypothetical protein